MTKFKDNFSFAGDGDCIADGDSHHHRRFVRTRKMYVDAITLGNKYLQEMDCEKCKDCLSEMY